MNNEYYKGRPYDSSNTSNDFKISLKDGKLMYTKDGKVYVITDDLNIDTKIYKDEEIDIDGPF